uniref:Uncharacterized protein n=1 Tax=Sphenodon punctatus TaxID=8508 RepID=A0A8D0GGF1_SPHPU
MQRAGWVHGGGYCAPLSPPPGPLLALSPQLSAKMMKFRFRRQGNDPQREKIKQELFAFNKTVEHGFPNQPSSLAYDPKLRIMAVGTKSGAVKMYPLFKKKKKSILAADL